LYEITRNPLLVTILCVISSYNLPLPKTEIKLYDDRIKLLTGYYDSVKNISTRISLTPQNLELLAKKIAFQMHLLGKRVIEFSDLEALAIKELNQSLSKQEIIKGLKDLIDPCNILVPMNDEGHYGFGHLRFQEHLSAIELLSNRSINLLNLLPINWWQGALLLMSQMTNDVSWLIKELGHEVFNSKYKFIFEIIKSRPKLEKQLLKIQLLKVRDDYYDFNIDEVNEDDFFYDDEYNDVYL
jgi:hypothetical protein